MDEKPIDWRGSSLDDLKAVPEDARIAAGFALHKVQHGQDPGDFKVISDWGPGVMELQLNDGTGSWRVVYVAKFEEAIYVLHSFQKKTQKTSKSDVSIITRRW
ncbi:type II toxin-antitoxin system RelE/ParE family toxin [Erwiniaceae bacterium BAC15a-03b]|uniref:Type II toxin-antitoxin system RelE/ParE family toxin n=1 Tax=Winslowiella arboricola TaxID=2978220 RepID=A0A9J6Q0X9_9GAMM|nr:type II toxin-antitoxin system RelE/ParE family toxin [Winslowiella arboricola]MCU5774945.1 type II toxin-antitoxin system RelE/ParE family toxin [Winslowiella arboricola]MCU5779903.1 type II toxin-antitoxin system RelE/ParE family toxin [Winslowiella arboricola]